MTLRLLAPLLAVLLGACAGLPRDAATGTCMATARETPSDTRIALAIDEARRQHHAFGGQTIETDGGMFRVGQNEAAWSRARGGSAPAWQRVAEFWQSLGDDQPPTLRTSVGRVWRSEVAPVVAGDGEPELAQIAIHEALLRVAIVDTPWSAAFISHLMKTAGFSPAEFAFSDSHSDYVRAALEASAAEAEGRMASHAFRACDVATTPPRAGDLLCATRAGTAGITRFDALAAAMAAWPMDEGFAMHCDLVVHAGGGRLDVIGGNVLQSVTLARMTVDRRKVLSDAYVTGAGPRRDCAREGEGCRGHLSRRPWLVLLQFRR